MDHAKRDFRVLPFSLKHLHGVMVLLMGYDVLATAMAYFLALWLRFDCEYTAIPGDYLSAWLRFAPLYAAVSVAVFFWLRLYHSVWRFASYSELLHVLTASLITAALHTVGITVLYQRMPITYYFVGAMLQFLFVLGIRFSYRFISLLRSSRAVIEDEQAVRVMLVGAGAAGQTILRDTRNAPELREHVVCIIDDDPAKWGLYLEDVPIIGGRDDILSGAEQYKVQKIYVALPSASAATF